MNEIIEPWCAERIQHNTHAIPAKSHISGVLHQSCLLCSLNGVTSAAESAPHIGTVVLLHHPGQFLPAKGPEHPFDCFTAAGAMEGSALFSSVPPIVWRCGPYPECSHLPRSSFRTVAAFLFL